MKVKDTITGFIETVIEKTSSSWNITQTKRTIKGINCTNWFDMTLKENKNRFQVL